MAMHYCFVDGCVANSVMHLLLLTTYLVVGDVLRQWDGAAYDWIWAG